MVRAGPTGPEPTHTEAGPTDCQSRSTTTSEGAPFSLRRQIGVRSNGSDFTSISSAQASDFRPDANRFIAPSPGGSPGVDSLELPPYFLLELEPLLGPGTTGSPSGSAPLHPILSPLDWNIDRKLFQNPTFVVLTLFVPMDSVCFLRSLLDRTRPIQETLGEDGSDRVAAGLRPIDSDRLGKSRMLAGLSGRRFLASV